MAATITTRKQAEEQLVRKAQQDPAFRKALIADPKAAIAGELGIGFADSVNLRVVEETASTFYLVLPAQQPGELDDAQLAAVAGGLRTAETVAGKGNVTPADILQSSQLKSY